MKKSIGDFLGLGGVNLCWQSWRLLENAKGVVIMVHGGNNYSDLESYDTFAKELVENKYSVYSYDQRGFGRSEGKQMYMKSWEVMRADLHIFLHFVRIREPKLPIFAFGLSFGGLLVLDQAIIAPRILSGVVTASISRKQIEISSIVKGMINIVGRLFPGISINAEPQEVYKGAKSKLRGDLWKDPICPTKLTLGFVRNLLKRQSEIGDDLKYIEIPVFHIQGGKDDIALQDSSLVDRLGSKNNKYQLYKETGHDIFLSGESPIITKDIVNWLNERVR